MLEHAGLDLVGLDLDLVAVEVEAAHEHGLGAHHLDVQAGDATGTPRRRPTRRRLDDLGVDDRPSAPRRSPTRRPASARRSAGRRGRGPSRCRTACRTSRRRGGRPCRRCRRRRGLGLQHRVAEGADLFGHACQATDADGALLRRAHQAVDVAPTATVAWSLPDGVVHAARPTAACSATAGSTPARRCCCGRRRRSPTAGVLLDLGCGTGAIALTHGPAVAGRSTVWAVDVNERARALCAANAAANGIDQRPRWPRPTRCPATSASTRSGRNPPIRIGKAAAARAADGVAAVASHRTATAVSSSRSTSAPTRCSAG